MNNIRERAAQASFLHERVQGLTESISPSPEQLTAWEACVCMQGDRAKFDERLSFFGTDRDGALALTGEQAWRGALPDWVLAFDALLALFPFAAEIPGADALYARTEPHIGQNNFSRSMLPFLAYADGLLADTDGQWTDAALLDMRVHLLCEITRLCAPVYQAERRGWLMTNHPAALFGDHTAYNEVYRARLWAEGWPELLLKYPVLTRQIHTLCAQWAENAAFLSRCLRQNRTALVVDGLLHAGAGKVAHIEMGAGDRHGGGRQVAVLTFENGEKVVFKPRSLKADQAFAAFLDWLRQSGYDHSIKTLRTVTGDDWGFVKHVENEPLEDEGGFARYYARMGEIAALLYAFGGNDFHHENVIAWGEFPVLIDTETLLLHKVRPFAQTEDSGDMQVLDTLRASVLRTGLFPDWRKDRNGKLFNIGGLYIHQDVGNTPHWRGERRSVEAYEGAFKAGFAAVYRHLLAHKALLVSANSPLHQFDCANFRFLTRQTQVYADVLRHMNTPAFLQDGLAYSMQAERLAPAFLFFAEGQTLRDVWPLYESEYGALVQMDVPIFFGAAGSLLARSSLARSSLAGASVPYFEQSAIGRAKALCAGLSEAGLSAQMELIDAAFGLVRGNDAHKATGAAPLPKQYDVLSDQQMLDEAMAIHERIMASAVGGDSPAWLVVQENPEVGLSLQTMGMSLYDGKVGLCVFMAALYRATGDPRLKRDAMRTVADLCEGLMRQGSPLSTERAPLGYGQGLGGLLRGLDLAARYLGEESIRRAMMKIPVTQAMVGADAQIDVIGGVAGMSIAAHHLGDRALLIQCAERIRQMQDRVTGRWTVNGTSLAGLGHGAAGMALAMLRGYQAGGSADLLDGAKQAIAFENTLYDAARHNWRDMRNPKEPGFMYGWCSGAPGIGLARLAGLSVLDNGQVRQDIENAVMQAREPFAGSDHFCCGQAARVDFLIEAARELERPALLDEARGLMSAVVARNRAAGDYAFNSRKIGVNPSAALFQGLAGVGYALVRCALPDAVETVLV